MKQGDCKNNLGSIETEFGEQWENNAGNQQMKAWFWRELVAKAPQGSSIAGEHWKFYRPLLIANYIFDPLLKMFGPKFPQSFNKYYSLHNIA